MGERNTMDLTAFVLELLHGKRRMTYDQAKAQLLFNDYNTADSVILDTETTGLYDAEIVEVAVIDLDGDVVFHSLVKPVHEIPESATAVHGITNEMVKDAPSWLEVWEKLFALIEDRLVLIYNAEFDTRLMIESFEAHLDDDSDELYEYVDQVNRLTVDVECVMQTYANLIDSPRWVKLAEAAGREIAHRALDDCRACLDVVKKCYMPNFSEAHAEKVKLVNIYKRNMERINTLSELFTMYSKELAERTAQNKELLAAIFGVPSETKKETATAIAELGDYDTDDDLPF